MIQVLISTFIDLKYCSSNIYIQYAGPVKSPAFRNVNSTTVVYRNIREGISTYFYFSYISNNSTYNLFHIWTFLCTYIFFYLLFHLHSRFSTQCSRIPQDFGTILIHIDFNCFKRFSALCFRILITFKTFLLKQQKSKTIPGKLKGMKHLYQKIRRKKNPTR